MEDGVQCVVLRVRLVLFIGYSSLAQSVEHAAVNRSVVGSSPTGGVEEHEATLSRIARFWPHGQAVKTSPFHGGNTSSNLVGVIKIWRRGQVVRHGSATPLSPVQIRSSPLEGLIIFSPSFAP